VHCRPDAVGSDEQVPGERPAVRGTHRDACGVLGVRLDGRAGDQPDAIVRAAGREQTLARDAVNEAQFVSEHRADLHLLAHPQQAEGVERIRGELYLRPSR
jgi:hypothetical protein